jgi:type I restriction enzyme R subunit
MPIFRMLKREIFGEDPAIDPDAAMLAQESPLYGMKEEERISKLVALTQEIYGEIERELKLVGFWESIPARNKLIADLQKAILQPEFAKMPGLVNKRKHIISRLMEIAEKTNDTILYAN